MEEFLREATSRKVSYEYEGEEPPQQARAGKGKSTTFLGVLAANLVKERRLIRETKWLQRIGVEVPEAAKMVLLQEGKFKHYYQQLTYTLKEYDRVMGTISSIDVNKMKGELAIKNTELAEAQKKSELLLKEISASTAIAEKEKKKVAVIVESVSKKAGEISAVKEDAERDLAKAQPALDAAVAALNSKFMKGIVM
ncbi:hypothetical protein PPROV_000055500 [Pycnococcus provasolii]|uniref:Dynein heavy chain tail domain-containing protein n=1 Tax=Pycnococcus provasolii TaxID=41880 RepID=A0A830H5B3_9CHLO|nr:hypothetical protein PPROV_000055500 [Pycnococcus provasolii]